MRIAWLSVVFVMFAGCTDDGPLAPESLDGSPADDTGTASPRADDVSTTQADEAPQDPGQVVTPTETLFLRYGADCVTMDGELTTTRPSERACWHLPAPVGMRTFTGQATHAYDAGTGLTGVLELYPQAPTPVDLELTVYAAGTRLGSTVIQQDLIVARIQVAWEISTLAPVAQGDDVRLEISYGSPTVADYVVTGPSTLTLG